VCAGSWHGCRAAPTVSKECSTPILNGRCATVRARRLVARLPDSVSKAEEWAALGCQQEAAEVAAKLRDSDLFARIQNAVSATSPAGLAIAQVKERFASTFRQ
jgi:hypothetical protein